MSMIGVGVFCVLWLIALPHPPQHVSAFVLPHARPTLLWRAERVSTCLGAPGSPPPLKGINFFLGLKATAPTKSESPAHSASTPSLSLSETSSKLRQLKDRMWVRETLEDLTAAEFASSLTVEENAADGKKKRKTRAVDFENLLNKLDVRIEEMCVLASPEIAKEMGQTCYVLERRVVGDEGKTKIENSCYSLAENIGMGNVVCTTEEREALLNRLIATRERLINFTEKSKNDDTAEDLGTIDDIRSQLNKVKNDTIVEKKEDKISNTTQTRGSRFDPSLYVREDGTIDWDGALQDREALKKFGSAVWSRINGQDPETSQHGENKGKSSSNEDHHSGSKVVTAKIIETKTIRDKKDRLDTLVNELYEMELEHTKLLNSAIPSGQAIANVNLATINPALRVKIRASSDELEKKKGEVTFQTLNYELERIFTYLEGEMGSTATKGYIPLQDRLNVAEFGLLESQIDSFNRQIELGESLDGDVLAVVADQVTDFKRRLGIDYYITGLTFDSEAIQIWLKDILMKAKKGLIFYVKGTRLFIDDMVFCLNLIGRALQGYTLKPREVRTLRRSFKDLITFIPVVIILIIPLSPIGHALVFGAIQRVFPDFFPSCFTERRQNLLELYESTEYSAVTIDESWQEKLVRLLQAMTFFAAQVGKKLYSSIGGAVVEKPNSEGNEKKLEP